MIDSLEDFLQNFSQSVDAYAKEVGCVVGLAILTVIVACALIVKLAGW